MSPVPGLTEVGARAGSSAANSDWALALGAVAAVLVVVGYAVVVGMTVAGWRASRRQRGRPGPRRLAAVIGSAGPVTADDLIDVHAALSDATSLRMIAGETPAVREPDLTSAHHS
ncbi:MAG TPA: hypothetical protein VHK65_06500 [Candidatus Dormibacteraeota bacterium]|nr:hypothetical protein [Candidatus Dormibacteraeota bacterium]